MIKLSFEKQVHSITDGQLQTLVLLLPDVLLKSKADNTVKINFQRVWSENVEYMIKLSLEKQVNSITHGQVQPLVLLLPDVLLKSKADNTVKSYISGLTFGESGQKM